MEIIENIFDNINVYYSLIIYEQSIPISLIKTLEVYDYPVVTITNMNIFNEYQENYRMFVMDVNNLNELIFMKQNDLHQFNVIWCISDEVFTKVTDIIQKNKPTCYENIIILKI